MGAEMTPRQVYEQFRSEWNAQRTRGTIQLFERDLCRWEKLSGDPAISSISTATLIGFHEAATRHGFADETIRHTIRSIRAILNCARRSKLIVDIPDNPRLRKGVARNPPPPSLDEFNTVVSIGIELQAHGGLPGRRHPGWFRTVVALAWFTAARHDDMLRMKWSQFRDGILEYHAVKTGKVQLIPIHPVLSRILREAREWADGPYVVPVSRAVINRTFRIVSEHTGRGGFSMQNIRKLSARCWERAHPGAGALILGHSLPRATAYYLDAPEILQHALPKLVLPRVFASEINVSVPMDATSPPSSSMSDLFGTVATNQF